MAAYREHITVSFGLGVGVAVGSTIWLGFTPAQGILAGCLTGIGGMLPDLDSQSGRPVREIFGLTAALAPMLLMRRLLDWGHGETDWAMLFAVVLYLSIRHGAAYVLGKLAVHRGMFHSIPAMLIAGEMAFLGYKTEDVRVKFLMGIGVCIGFASHLLLDELYAVEWRGVHVRLNKFAGSAFKFFGKSWGANLFTYALLCLLTYATLLEEDILKQPLQRALAVPAPVEARAWEAPDQQAERIERQDLRIR
jgi:hypothetical protein